jgi:hypothetical protein
MKSWSRWGPRHVKAARIAEAQSSQARQTANLLQFEGHWDLSLTSASSSPTIDHDVLDYSCQSTDLTTLGHFDSQTRATRSEAPENVAHEALAATVALCLLILLANGL